jgi:kinesin family protein C2/C3
VFCRIRPVGASKQDADLCLHMKDTETVSTLRPGDVKERSFYFDRVFGAASSQADVFEPAAPFVTSVADGYNVCVFAYGPTGSGKTHTMVGMGGRGSDDRGFVFRAVESLYAVIKDRSLTHEYQVSMSIMEIYNETIRDLVEGDGSTGLAINSEANGGSSIQIVGLSETAVTGPEGAIALMEIAHRNRQVGSTQLNEHSSRSHLLQLFHVRSRVIASGVTSYSKMYLIDLAGSECAGKSGAVGSRLSEASAINKSLAALHDVVNALAQKASHVPYRNSKLTHVLQDSLGGRAKTLMYVMASPLSEQSTESLGSLHFAERCKKVILGPAVKQGPDPQDSKAAAEAREAAKRARAESELLKSSVASVQGEVSLLRGSLSNLDQLQAKARELLNMPQPLQPKKKTLSLDDECSLRASHMRDVLQKIEKMVQQQRDSEERHKIALAEAGRRTDMQKSKLKQGKDASLAVKSKLAAYRGSPVGAVPDPLELPMDISSTGYTIDAYPCHDDGGQADAAAPPSPANDEYSRENSRDTSATVKLPRVAAHRMSVVNGSSFATNVAASPYGQPLAVGGSRAPIQRKGGRGYDAGHARAMGGWK